MRRTVFNQKGGVGKTSITCNLAAAFAKAGLKTLVIDLDSQANASQYLLGTRVDDLTKTIANFFEASLSFKLFGEPLADALVHTDFDDLWLIPSERSLSELQPKLEGRYKIFKLRDSLNDLIKSSGFDAVFFDTPPALNFYSMSALMASDRVLIPFDCDAFSANALKQVMDVIHEVASDHQPELTAEGIIINHFQAQARLPLEAIQKLRDDGFPVLEPFLSTSIVMRESHAAHSPLPYFRPRHKLAEEYAALAEILIKSEPGKTRATKTSPLTGTNSRRGELGKAIDQ